MPRIYVLRRKQDFPLEVRGRAKRSNIKSGLSRDASPQKYSQRQRTTTVVAALWRCAKFSLAKRLCLAPAASARRANRNRQRCRHKYRRQHHEQRYSRR